MRGIYLRGIYCNDDTCKYNEDHFCKHQFPEMQVDTNINGKPCNVCMSYEDRRKENDTET